MAVMKEKKPLLKALTARKIRVEVMKTARWSRGTLYEASRRECRFLDYNKKAINLYPRKKTKTRRLFHTLLKINR